MSYGKSVIFLSVLACGILAVSCAGIDVYKDPSAPVEKRVEDLLSKMTLEEKIYQVTQWTYGKNMNANNVETSMKEVSSMIGSLLYRSTSPEYYNMIQHKAVEESRLGIPILCGFDAIHGYKTIFPIPLAQSCSWNPDMVARSCAVAAEECRLSGVHWTFSPVLDVARDSRWGRVSEGYGEDPYLTSEMGVAAVRGYQGEDLSDTTSIAACLKHFVGYSWSQGGRDYQYTEISDQTLWDTALPPFEAAVKAGAATVMSAFNDISGVPASANSYTMNEVLRGKWGFDGLVVSDWGAVVQLMSQGAAADTTEACMKAITAGLDMDMVDDVYLTSLDSLITSGQLDESVLDEAVRRILRVKFRLGLFEKPYIAELPESERFLLEDSRKLARAFAAETFVLLKNEGDILPLSSDRRTVALLGPMADNREDLMGSWNGQGDAGDVVTIREGLEASGMSVKYFGGCPFDGDDRSGFTRAKAIAAGSDVVVVCLGEKKGWSGENASRAGISLPRIQLDFLRTVASAGKPVVVLVSSGRPVEMEEIARHADALVEIWQPGTEGGNAVADVLSGLVNPSGKLTMTFPLCSEQQPSFYNQRPSARPFMGHYQDISKKPVYEFGYGLSYSDFEYGELRIDHESVATDGRLTAEIDVTNVSDTDGQETVLWFIQDPVASVTRPVKELRHFEKRLIRAGQTETFRFEIEPQKHLSYYDGDGVRHLEAGDFRLMAGPRKVSFALL